MYFRYEINFCIFLIHCHRNYDGKTIHKVVKPAAVPSVHQLRLALPNRLLVSLGPNLHNRQLKPLLLARQRQTLDLVRLETLRRPNLLLLQRRLECLEAELSGNHSNHSKHQLLVHLGTRHNLNNHSKEIHCLVGMLLELLQRNPLQVLHPLALVVVSHHFYFNDI